MELLLGLAFLGILIVVAVGLGRNRPKTTAHFTLRDAGWTAVVGLMLVMYYFIVYG